jgi:aminopeptidase N
MQTVPRLIQTFIPKNYNLSLSMDRLGRKFSGLVSIKGELPAGSDRIALHAKDLEIESALIDGKTAEFSFGPNDELKISHPDLTPGSHLVVVKFSGNITDPMHGLYPCYYEDGGVKKELLATQFESHHAREVFPCIDEPEAKATFDVCLTTETGVSALSNMPISYQTNDNHNLVTTFQTTPRMSTYLLAWVVGELNQKTAQTKRGVEVSVWATPAQATDNLDFALDIAVRSIDFYEQYFGVEYPLPKSDHVALPDFSSAAMENWGLITYREIALLSNPKSGSISSRQYIATVIAHELAHQWFGNLVTMKWWNNLWLNESFATLMEYLAVDAMHPEWNIWLDFSTSESIMALRRDSIDGVQPVQIDVNHPDEINTLFDGAIVYAKGARLLRMLQNYVGDADFQTGLKQYFINFAYRNTEADDLWKEIAKASDKNITAMMNTWISQPGYPVLNVSQVDKKINLSQEQFFIGPHQPSDRIWPIPLAALPADMPNLMTDKKVVIDAPTDARPRFNVGDTAHYITNYSETMLNDLIQSVGQNQLATIDRIQLLNETTLIARSGRVSTARLIPLIEAYKNETEEHVWTMIYIALSELRQYVEDDEPAERKLRDLSARLARAQYDRLGWNQKPGESEDDTKLRATIISMMLYGEDQSALAKARELYDNKSLKELDAELRPLIISSVVRYGDEQLVDDLLQTYLNTQSSELRQDIRLGITSTRSQTKISELLNNVKDGSLVRAQDATYWFVYLIRGRESRSAAWQWVRDNWTWVVDTYGTDKSYDDYPRYSAGALTTKQQLQEYIAFFEPKKDIPALRRVIEMGISEIEGRVELIERDKVAVRKALNNL